MIYVLAQYWPFMIVAFLAGIPVGWWFRNPVRRQTSEGGDP